jgi:hypothetical protein
MHIPEAAVTLERELRGIFGGRMQSFVVYGPRPEDHHTDTSHGHDHAIVVHTMAVVDALSADDLRACSNRIAAWQDEGLAAPLLVAAHEFGRSLDAFPFEFGAILSDHVVVSGANPFEGLSVDAADMRRACEVQARSHLLHLRQGYLETRGRSDALAVLIVRSAPACAALTMSVARLDGHATSNEPGAAARAVERLLQLPPSGISGIVALTNAAEISSAEAERLFPPYLAAIERLVAYIDGWTR